jgi:hypothetical protein
MQTDGSGDEPDGFQIGNDRTRIQRDGFDPEEWGKSVVAIQDRLEERGFEHTKNASDYSDSTFDSLDEYQEKKEFWISRSDIFTPRMDTSRDRPFIPEPGSINQENNEENIFVGLQMSDTETNEEGEVLEGAVSPYVVAKDGEGWAAMGDDVSEASFSDRNLPSSDSLFSYEKGPITVWGNYDKPREMSILVEYSEDGNEPNPLFEGVVEQIDEDLEQNADFAEGIEYNGASMGQFGLQIDVEGDSEEVADRVETAYTAVRKALGDNMDYEV